MTKKNLTQMRSWLFWRCASLFAVMGLVFGSGCQSPPEPDMTPAATAEQNERSTPGQLASQTLHPSLTVPPPALPASLTPLPPTPTLDAMGATLTARTQWEDACANLKAQTPTNERAVGRLWFPGESFLASALFKQYLDEYQAGTPDQADVLVCLEREFIDGPQCKYNDTTHKMRGIIYTVTLADMSTLRVLQQEKFPVELPEACPANEDEFRRMGLVLPVTGTEAAVRWMFARWVVDEAAVFSAESTPTVSQAEGVTDEQIETVFNQLCAQASRMDPASPAAAGPLYVVGESAGELYDSLPSEMKAEQMLATQTLVCVDYRIENEASCYYSIPEEDRPLTLNIFGNLETVETFTAYRRRVFYDLTLVDVTEERVTARFSIPGSEPPACLDTILGLPWVTNITNPSIELAPGEQAKLDGDPPEPAAVGEKVQTFWDGPREAPAARYLFTRHGYLEGTAVNDMDMADDGTLWVAADTGVFHFDPVGDTDGWEYFGSATAALPFESAVAVTAASGTVWAAQGTNRPTLAVYDGSIWSAMGVEDFSPQLLAVDADGRLWSNLGIWNGATFDRLPESMGMHPQRIVRLLVEDGALWVGTPDKLVRMAGSEPEQVIEHPFLHGAVAWAFAPGGTVLAGESHGLAVLREGELYRPPEIYGQIREIAVDGAFIWLGTYDKGLFHFDGRTWNHIDLLDGFQTEAVTRLLIDRQGVVWVGTEKGLVSVKVLD